MELPDGIAEPNGPAFVKLETRTGPPLDYVAEKLRSCLEMLHSLYDLSSREIPADLPKHDRFRNAPFLYSSKGEGVLSHCFAAFKYALVSYLVLNNLLAVANDHGLFQRLLSMSHEDFQSWLDRVDGEGSVT